MIRPLARALISRVSIAVIELVIVVPMALAILEVSKAVFVQPDLKEPMDIITGIGMIMIGLGVVLEERKALREIFGLVDGPDEAWQSHLDHSCHHAGVGQLVLGLFAEICIEMIRIPNTVIYTGDVDDYLVVAGSVMVAVAALLLVRHAISLLTMTPRQISH